MAKQVVTSGLLKKLGSKLDEAVKKHADDETDWGFIRLPGGITNGIAQLSQCKFEQYKADTRMKRLDGQPAVGEYYFSCRASVIEPDTVQTPNGPMKVKGLQTSIMVPVMATKDSKGKITSLDTQIETILNQMRRLGGDEFTAGAGAENMEELASQLEQAAPHFRFSTSQSAPSKEYPEPRVWENWNGIKGLEDYTPPDEEAANTNDGSGKEEPVNEATEEVEDAEEPEAEEAEQVVEEEQEQFDEFGDIPGLVAKADAKKPDTKARSELTRLAEAAGYSEEEIENADNWAAVGEMISNPKTSEEGGEEEPPEAADTEEAEWEPIKDQVYKYKPLIKNKSGKMVKAAKGVECNVEFVSKKNRTVKLKDMDDGKTIYEKVAWDDLESAGD